VAVLHALCRTLLHQYRVFDFSKMAILPIELHKPILQI
jgi:hypothetical protein